MIEKMKVVHVVSSVSHKDEMLEALRNIGILHLAEKQSATKDIIDGFSTLSKTISKLQEYAKGKKNIDYKILSDDEFESEYKKILEALHRKDMIVQKRGELIAEIERISSWGNFSPKQVRELQETGYDLHFYRIAKKELKKVIEDGEIDFIRLSQVEKMETIATVGKIPKMVVATEFVLPEYSLDELKNTVELLDEEAKECETLLENSIVYLQSFKQKLLEAQNKMIYSSASATTNSDDDFVWITGYMPEQDVDLLKCTATKNGWAWVIDDVAEDDENVPTKVKYNRVSKFIKPIFDILGILPGYREQDISMYFLMFFTLFFAMIIGDAGYGCLILAGTGAYAIKKKQLNTGVYLLLILSIATIVWGAITGTWFGMVSAMNVPLLKSLVLPGFANYPEAFADVGITSQMQQNNIMIFSFSIGAIQMSIGSLLAIRKKISEKNLSWISDLGWIIATISMYLLALYLVVDVKIVTLVPIFVCVGIAFLMLLLFGGMTPDKTFVQGLKSGFAGAFTVFLNTISCFGNVMSYIRLFAVGMAGLAISQSFNGIAAGMTSGPMLIIATVVVIIGHVLNLVMCFLSVVVHGVRLNVLEFSGQVGLEWTGIPYEPFKKNDKVKN